MKVPKLYNGRGRPIKIAPSHGGSGLPSNTWFPGSSRVLNPNGISFGSAVFAGLTHVTDYAIGLVYRLTAMRPKMSGIKPLW